MNYRNLGRTGFDVSEIAHGLWGMGDWSGSDDRQSVGGSAAGGRPRLQLFRYGLGLRQGHSDALLGQILATNPGKRLYAASKIPPLNDKWPASPKTSITTFSRRITFSSTPS